MFSHWRNLHRHWEDWVNVLVGMWLAFTPWLFDFEAVTAAMVGAAVAGAILIFFASLALVREEAWEEWVNIALGGALIAAPFALGFADHPTAPGVFVAAGVVVAGLAAFELWEERTAHAPTPRA